MSTMSDTTILTFFLAVRIVLEGHRMVVKGWVLFEEAMEAAGVGDLLQLLHHLRGMMTLTPAPVPMDVQQGVEVETSRPADSPVKQRRMEKPVVIVVNGERR